MPIDLKITAALTDEERDALAAMQAAVYPPEVVATLPGRHVQWASPERHILVRDDAGRLVSHVGLLLRDGTHDARPVRIGGIGGVATAPEARGKGHAGAAIAAAGAFFADEGVDFALLVCTPALAGFYGRFGWRTFGGLLRVEQHGQPILFTAHEPMTLPVRGPAPASGAIDLRGLPW